MYQRYAYRIVMQGYWLEGGSDTFWFQPVYRWIVGPLHLVFGDSSVGERFWDGVCLLVTALFSFRVVRVAAGFHWGILAAAVTLAVLALSVTWSLIGLGLSEISAAGWLNGAALLALRGRRGQWRWALGASVLGVLAFYTRLNALPMALGLAVFALPLRQPIRTALRPSRWWSRVSWPTAIAVPVTLGFGLLLFAWRTGSRYTSSRSHARSRRARWRS